MKDSWDLHTVLSIRPQQPLNVYGIKDSWDMHTFFFVQLDLEYPGNPGPGCSNADILMWFWCNVTSMRFEAVLM